MPSLEDAIALAVSAHRGQRDKVGQPYILHSLRVMLCCDTEAARITAVLHDVVEDTPHTLTELRTLGYAEEVLQALDCLTRRAGESYEAFIQRVKGNALARRVKLADLADNMDIRRLSELSASDVERLRRYQRAWCELGGED